MTGSFPVQAREVAVKAIVAVDKNWGIGKDGDLLFHLPGDMKYFREKTKGGIIIIGRKTLESFPGRKPLPGRTNIVITRNEDYQAEECIICHSPEEAVAVAEALDLKGAVASNESTIEEVGTEDAGCDGAEIYVCGGGEIYRMMMPWCDEILVTKIEADMKADTYFPDLDEDPEFELLREGETQEEQGISYKFTTYKRKNEQ